jgi:hypothetical protein
MSKPTIKLQPGKIFAIPDEAFQSIQLDPLAADIAED